MIKGTVTRDDAFWQGHPDVTLFKDTLVVVFRESDRHMTMKPTKIKCTVKARNKPFTSPVEIASSTDRLNCPRLVVVDEVLYLICDKVQSIGSYLQAENDEDNTEVLFWRTNDLIQWDGPIHTGIRGIVPDRICRIPSGYIVATHTKMSDKLVQNIWHSASLDGTWSKHTLCESKEYNLCEASVCQMSNGLFALMRENSGLGLPALVCHSDDGLHWSSPQQTRMFGCHRPVTGVLRSGNILTTYRESCHSFAPKYWAKNTFACLTHVDSAKLDFRNSIILPLDHDHSPKPDSGYTGWVQMSDESIFIVNYITSDAPRPYIRWYQIMESEF